jgi:hypothetical protein
MVDPGWFSLDNVAENGAPCFSPWNSYDMPTNGNCLKSKKLMTKNISQDGVKAERIRSVPGFLISLAIHFKDFRKFSIVFQLRIVAGMPSSLSILPR